MVSNRELRSAPNNQLTTHGVKRLPGDTQSLNLRRDNLGPCLTITPELLAGFRDWLLAEQGTSEGTVRKYMYYLPRLQGLHLCRKQDVSRAFELMRLTKVSYEAFSRLLTYVERKLEGYEDLAARLRRAMPKKPKSKEDTYVPPDERVRELLHCLSEKHDQVYYLTALVLAYTGLRGTEARYILVNAQRLQAVELPYGAVRVHLDPEMQRGSKRAFVAYMPRWLWERVKARQGGMPHEDTVEKRFRECGLPLKYLRKWWRQKAKELGVDSETIEAFQGRPSTVGGRHYTDWIPILDREYQQIMKHLDNKLGTLTTVPTSRKL